MSDVGLGRSRLLTALAGADSDRAHLARREWDPELIDVGIAADTPVVVVLGPWGVAGVAVPPDDNFPDRLEIDGASVRVGRSSIEGLGPYRVVELVAAGVHVPSQRHARKLARSLAKVFRVAVERARLGGWALSPRATGN